MVTANAGGDKAGKALRHTNRLLEQLIRRDDLMNQPACATILRRVGRAAENILEMLGAVAKRMISNAMAGNGTPTRSSVTPMRPLSVAISRRSAAQASTQPPAIAWPLSAATTGFG